MALITKLTIERFRCFEKLTVEGLTRVNLIIGGNNSGKTALLEAVEWHASGGSPVRLWEGLERRGARLELEGEERERTYDAAELFYGRQLDADSPEQLGRFLVSDGEVKSEAQVMAYGRSRNESNLEIHCSSSGRSQPPLPLVARRGITQSVRRELRGERNLVDHDNVYFVAAGLPNAKDFGPLWQSIAATPAEDQILGLMKHVDPRIRKFAVISPSLETSRYSGIVMLLERSDVRQPLSAFGDGLKRSAFMACALATCRNGTLLIDEIDQGLHYTVLPRLWAFLVDAAKSLDIQVFATTHSKDCLEALVTVHQRDETLAREISVHRLDLGQPHSADASGSTAVNLVASDVELR